MNALKSIHSFFTIFQPAQTKAPSPSEQKIKKIRTKYEAEMSQYRKQIRFTKAQLLGELLECEKQSILTDEQIQNLTNNYTELIQQYQKLLKCLKKQNKTLQPYLNGQQKEIYRDNFLRKEKEINVLIGEYSVKLKELW